MRRGNLSFVYSVLVFSSCFLHGFSLPQHRISANEFGRKFGSTGFAETVSNNIEEGVNPAKVTGGVSVAANSPASAAAKEEGSLMTTVVEIVLKFLPAVIDAISGSTGPSQTDRIEGIDLNGEDPFSVKNIVYMGLKLFLAIAGGTANEKSDTPISGIASALQPVMEAVISTMTGSNDRQEVTVMAKQATEVLNLVISLVQALTTSMSQSRMF